MHFLDILLTVPLSNRQNLRRTRIRTRAARNHELHRQWTRQLDALTDEYLGWKKASRDGDLPHPAAEESATPSNWFSILAISTHSKSIVVVKTILYIDLI